MKPKNTLTAFLRSLSFCIYFLLLAFTTGDSKSEYILPPMAASVCSADIDLDGAMDIVVGHNYNASTQWSGISIMYNNGNGYFELFDSVFLFGWQPDVQLANLNSNPLLEIIAKYEDYENEMEYISIINNFNLNDINYFPLNTYIGVEQINNGDINGDGNIDIVVASANGQFWGVLYNDGLGNFSEPEYHNMQYWPNDLAVGDIDGNGRDDIAFCGPETEIYFSFDTGFQVYPLTGAEHEIEIADIDLDGDLDIITMWGVFSASFIIYENQGYENFQQHIITEQPGNFGGLRTPDINNDSLPDFSYATYDNFFLLTNEGNYEFSEPQTISPEIFVPHPDYTWADIDNNNFLDLIIIRSENGFVPNLKILFNDGNGNFGDDPITEVEILNKNIQKSNLSCFPNPFIEKTTICFSTEYLCKAEIIVFGIDGQFIIKLNQEIYSHEENKINWNGTDQNGKEVKPGTYLLTLKVIGNAIQTAKLIKH